MYASFFSFFVLSSNVRFAFMLPPPIIHCEISKHLRAIACCSDVGWASWGWLLGPVFHWTDRSSSCSQRHLHQSTLDRPLGGIRFNYLILSFIPLSFGYLFCLPFVCPTFCSSSMFQLTSPPNLNMDTVLANHRRNIQWAPPSRPLKSCKRRL